MPENKKKKILVICDYYLPGFKSGGGMRTIVNMVERLSDRYDFYLVTRGHDGRLDVAPYTSVNIEEWNTVGPARVFYWRRNKFKPFMITKVVTIKRLVDEIKPDAVYLNSIFATYANYLMFLRYFGLADAPVVLAPCGELITAAMELKWLKKRLYLFISKVIGLHRGMFWKLTTTLELEDTEKFVGKRKEMYVAADLPPKAIFPDYDRSIKPAKVAGELKLVFLARFVRTKNFGFLLDLLPEISGKVSIDIIGDLEDQAYWRECEAKIKTLPSNITIKHVGVIDNRYIPKKLAEFHFLISPTRNENFGHIFLEALSAGTPLIISDRTPWLELEGKGIGWDIPLENKQAWIATLNRCVAMGDADYERLSGNARKHALDWLSDESLEKDTVAVLERALNAV